MSANVGPALTSLNAGELSPYMDGRIDMAKYQNGCSLMQNFRPIPQGPAVRRMGTRHVAPVKNQAHRTWMVPFIFSEDDSYVIEFGDHYIRFYTDNGRLLLSAPPPAWNGLTAYIRGDLVQSAGIFYYCTFNNTGVAPPNAAFWLPLTGIPGGGTIYEAYSPYGIADLTNSDGTFRLDAVQTGDTIFFAHPDYPPQKLARQDVNRWRFDACDITNGPFEDVDPLNGTQIYASAATGTGITLTANNPIFTADLVNTLFLVEMPLSDAYPVWEPGKAVGAGAEWRSDSNVYRLLGVAGTTGTIKPTHKEGAKLDGSTVGAGVAWLYVHSGYGIVRITAVAGLTATADVVSELPSRVVGVGNPTTKWARASWRSTVGYPSLNKIHRERLTYLRGQELWGSVSGDFENFAARDGAETLPDSAYHITIGSSETNAGVWMVSKDALLVGTRGAEFSVSQVTESEVFGPGNIKASQESSYGSRQVPPPVIGDSVLMTQRSGKRMRDVRFSFNTNSFEANDLMTLSGHIADGQIIQAAFALEPHSEMWACCADGDLIALTYQLEQDVVGWHPHRIGNDAQNQGAVESVVVIPSPDGTHDQLWLQVRRTINGSTTRYIEYMERDWTNSYTNIENALYSDSGATFDGFVPGATATLTGGVTWAPGETGDITVTGIAFVGGDVGDALELVGADGLRVRVRIDVINTPTTADVTWLGTVPVSLRGIASGTVSFARDVITGLGYLEGKEVTITVEGAAHPRRTVTAGAITLQSWARKVQVGLPADAILQTMRIEGGASNGTSQGKIKRIHQVTYRLFETLGGAAGPAGAEDLFEFRSSDDPMDQPPPFFTGDYVQPYNEGYNRDGRVRVLCNQALPFTLVAMYPQLKVEERT